MIARFKTSRMWPEVALTVVYWTVRLHNLTAFPVFDDESIHIRQAKMVWKLLPFSGADDGRILNILLYALFWPFGPGALWVSRAAYLLVGALGFVGLVKLGGLIFRRPAGWWAGTLFILLPSAFFFERLALADTLGIPLLALLALGSARATTGRDRPAVLLGGLALAGLVLAKLNNVMFLLVPLFAFALFRSSAGWQRSLGRVLRLYLVGAIALAPIVLFLVFRAHSTLGFANVAVRTTAMPLVERVARQTGTLAAYLGPYVTWPILGLCVVAVGAALWRRSPGAWYAVGLVAIPTAAFVVGANSLESRYLLPLLPGLALLAGFAADGFTSRIPIASAGLASAALVALVGLAGPFTFLWYGWTAPERLPLPASDMRGYMQDWPSGFGVEGAGRLILDRAAQGRLTVVVTEGWHIPGLTVHYGWEQDLHEVYDFTEPRLRIVWLKTGCDVFAAARGIDRPTLFVAERYRYAATIDCLQARKTLLASFPKPGGANVIDVYEVRPLP